MQHPGDELHRAFAAAFVKGLVLAVGQPGRFPILLRAGARAHDQGIKMLPAALFEGAVYNGGVRTSRIERMLDFDAAPAPEQSVYVVPAELLPDIKAPGKGKILEGPVFCSPELIPDLLQDIK